MPEVAHKAGPRPASTLIELREPHKSLAGRLDTGRAGPSRGRPGSRGGASSKSRRRAERAAGQMGPGSGRPSGAIEIEQDRYPFCLVWTPLPVVSWFLPLIGHTGISNSNGIIYDFSDDYHVAADNFAFGSPTKYYQFEPSDIPHANKAAAWDGAIVELSDQYARTRHTLCFNNCHQYIAAVLNRLQYGRVNDWSQRDVCLLITFHSTYCGYRGFMRQWWPLTAILLALLVFVVLVVL